MEMTLLPLMLERVGAFPDRLLKRFVSWLMLGIGRGSMGLGRLSSISDLLGCCLRLG